MQTFPNIVQDLIKRLGINIVQPLIGYLQQFTIPPPPFVEIIPDGSPFEYIAQEPGFIYILGGTISNISLIRGDETLVIATSGSAALARIVPVAIKDIVSVTYTILPTSMRFIPSYGQNTTS